MKRGTPDIIFAEAIASLNESGAIDKLANAIAPSKQLKLHLLDQKHTLDTAVLIFARHHHRDRTRAIKRLLDVLEAVEPWIPDLTDRTEICRLCAHIRSINGVHRKQDKMLKQLDSAAHDGRANATKEEMKELLTLWQQEREHFEALHSAVDSILVSRPFSTATLEDQLRSRTVVLFLACTLRDVFCRKDTLSTVQPRVPLSEEVNPSIATQLRLTLTDVRQLVYRAAQGF